MCHLPNCFGRLPQLCTRRPILSPAGSLISDLTGTTFFFIRCIFFFFCSSSSSSKLDITPEFNGRQYNRHCTAADRRRTNFVAGLLYIIIFFSLFLIVHNDVGRPASFLLFFIAPPYFFLLYFFFFFSYGSMAMSIKSYKMRSGW